MEKKTETVHYELRDKDYTTVLSTHETRGEVNDARMDQEHADSLACVKLGDYKMIKITTTITEIDTEWRDRYIKSYSKTINIVEEEIF